MDKPIINKKDKPIINKKDIPIINKKKGYKNMTEEIQKLQRLPGLPWIQLEAPKGRRAARHWTRSPHPGSQSPGDSSSP